MKYYRALDLQSLLDAPYQSRLLLRDCIVSAVKNGPFSATRKAMPISRDPDELHTRLHQFMKQQDASALPASNLLKTHSMNTLKPLLAYYFEDKPNNDTDPSDFEVLFNQHKQPFFKQRIMRGSSSFHRNKQSNPYSGNYGQNNHPRFGHSKGSQHSPQVHRINSLASKGKQMLRHTCGS